MGASGFSIIVLIKREAYLFAHCFTLDGGKLHAPVQ